jgi:hypothetical protein
VEYKLEIWVYFLALAAQSCNLIILWFNSGKHTEVSLIEVIRAAHHGHAIRLRFLAG